MSEAPMTAQDIDTLRRLTVRLEALGDRLCRMNSRPECPARREPRPRKPLVRRVLEAVIGVFV
jgi:hypothetical protein